VGACACVLCACVRVCEGVVCCGRCGLAEPGLLCAFFVSLIARSLDSRAVSNDHPLSPLFGLVLMVAVLTKRMLEGIGILRMRIVRSCMNLLTGTSR